MESSELHRGRLIDHIQLVVVDIAASRQCCGAVLEVLGIPIGGEAKDYFWADRLFISTPDSEAAQGALAGRHHLAFQASDCAIVDAFYHGGLDNGDQDNGKPGYHPGYYATFLHDPDRNNIEAAFHGEANRPMPLAPAVTRTL